LNPTVVIADGDDELAAATTASTAVTMAIAMP